MSPHWAVTVSISGEDVVTIERDCVSGREIGPAEERAIRTAARHLLAFIGMPEDERDPAPPDEDDDTVGADWDEMGYWDLDGEDEEDGD